jgi:hypothetical protein
MIRLTTLLLEKEDKSTLKVLCIGDSQTYAANSYAKQLSQVRGLDVTIVAKPNASLSEVYLLLQDNMTPNYDVVSIFAGDVDTHTKNPEVVIEQLKQIYMFVKKFDCILVAISTPTKEFSKDPDKYPSADRLARWIKNQTISDVTIKLTNLDNVDFKKDGILLDNDSNAIIASDWYTDVLNIVGSKKSKSDELPIDSDKLDNKLKSDLETLGYEGSESDAIAQLQKKNGLSVTGKVNAETKKALSHELETPKTPIKLASLLPRRRNVTSNTAIVNDVITFFVDKGLSVAGAAGIAGNLAVESGFKTYNPGDHGTSNGLAQWHNERWTGPDGFEAWCTKQGMDPWSVDGQLEFLWWELTKYFTPLIKYLSDEAVTPSNAAHQFAAKFERPSYISAQRMTNAEDYFESYSASI